MDEIKEGRPSGGITGDKTPATALGASFPYLRIRTRFLLSVLWGLLWCAFSIWVALPWFRDLGELVTLPVAIFAIVGIAIFPGYLNAFLVASLLLDRPRRLVPPQDIGIGPAWPPVTLLIAAWNEEISIETTLDHAAKSDYPGELRIIVIDDGSIDHQSRMVSEFAQTDPRVEVLTVIHGGKAAALNAGLAISETDFIATVDADPLLTPQPLRRSVNPSVRSVLIERRTLPLASFEI